MVQEKSKIYLRKMSEETYSFQKLPEVFYYEFFSEGPKGVIKAKSRDEEKIVKYSGAVYFREKDKKAKKFLKEHPVPAKFLQS